MVAAGRRRALICALAAACVLAPAVGAAGATPASYLDHLNNLCAGFAPDFARTVAALRSAVQRKDEHAYYAAVGQLMYLSLDEDTSIESVAVPASLQIAMSSALRDLRRGDSYLRLALGEATMGQVSGELAALAKLASLDAPVNSALIHAGLAECGTARG